MLLKKLEIFGFKSFAEKTSLEFEPGVTAIVGPNGCGKSNIVDAMKWVLGEQSAKELRGSAMEDVVFNGTELAERVNLAEVSLTISNEDGILPIEFSEVTISRRLFRNGESGYLINKVPVRLKDVHELIAGTGIGTKAYSLMEQGKMDLIVSSRPEERRYVFEEASGITKFKNKKKEATRKLEYTENNVLRVSDIVSEIRRQISSLERQARKAERYKVGYEELKEKELKSAGSEIKKYRESISFSSLEKNKMQKDSDFVNQTLQDKESFAKQLRDSIANSSERIAEEENNLREFKTKYQRNSERVQWDKQFMSESKEKIELLSRDLDEIQNRIDNSRLKLEETEKDKDYFQDQEEDLTAQIEQKKKDVLEINEKQDNLKNLMDELKNKVLEFNFELTQKRNLLLEIEGERKSLRVRLERLQEEREDIISQKSSQNEQIAQCLKDVESKEIELKQSEENVQGLTQERAELLNKKQSVDLEKVGLEKKITTFQTRLTSWREIASSGLGRPESLKIIQQESENVLGLLSEILQVGSEGVSKVELAFMPYLESLIIRTKAEALEVIRFCKKQGLFDVSIIVLDELEEYNYIEIAGAIPVAEHVQLRPEYKRLLYLIRDVYYVSDFDHAQELSLKYPGKRFLTDLNVILQRGGIAIGSNSSCELGYIDREGKIARLEKSLNDSELRFSELIKKISVLNNQSTDSEQALNLAEERKVRLNYDLVALRKSLEVNQENQSRLLQEEEVLNLDIDEIKSQLENDIARRDRLTLETEEKDVRLKETESDFLSSQTEYDNLMEEKHNFSIHLAQLEEKESSLNERKKQFHILYQTANSDLENLIKDQEKRTQDHSDTVAKISQLEEEIKRLEDENVNLNIKIEEGQMVLDNNKQDYEKLKSDFDREEDALIKLRNEYTTGKDDFHELDLSINEKEYKIKSIKDRIYQRYNISEIAEGDLTLEEERSLGEEIQESQDRLQKMGEVNLVAIEEHKQLQERLSFLEKQEKDLLEAKESLMAAIRKINKTTRELFANTFQEVRAAFKEIFPRLFGGGDADLILEEGVDCLEAGIVILARPPGKKLQSVSLLSGGEKALTALSLLFAIFKIKPSPFCILDEVDAPLDESNIDRFRRLLEEFAKYSQFLVITHNKRTISTADVMYGITMENTGISKIVSIKFQKTEASSAH
ncbi:MAG: chromosome segregation protein SMC [Candidatus Saelkia tenebricola]|nr:chromosome segregation protein SMC [Candidatus Saelkia tenebricola]